MDQYTPTVTEADIDRIVRRDYPVEFHDAIHEMIRSVEVIEKTRVVVACLKNGNRDLVKLKGELTNASGYYREILGEAEYPHWIKKMFHIERLSGEEKDKIIEKDKSQYLKWLHREGPPDAQGETRRKP